MQQMKRMPILRPRESMGVGTVIVDNLRDALPVLGPPPPAVCRMSIGAPL
jgi:hypothetical protein